jgi:hypothetical protein
LPPSLEPAEIEQVLRTRHGVAALIQTRIAREKTGYRLDCALFSADGQLQFILRAEDPMRLGRKMTRQLSRSLMPGSAASARMAAEQDDPWVLELFAHAMLASADGRAERARKFLRVVLHYEPHFAEAAVALEGLSTAAG